MEKTYYPKAWLMEIPVVAIVSFSAIVPLMTVINYPVQAIFRPQNRYFVGMEWFREILADPETLGAFRRQFLFSFAVLAIEIPLGIAMEESGAAGFLGDLIVGFSGLLPPLALLGVFYLFTALLTNVVSNNASVVLMIPVAASAAQSVVTVLGIAFFWGVRVRSWIVRPELEPRFEEY
jgi:hypothetical protein